MHECIVLLWIGGAFLLVNTDALRGRAKQSGERCSEQVTLQGSSEGEAGSPTASVASSEGLHAEPVQPT